MISSGASFTKFPAKGPVLEARKERVQLGQRGALGGFQLFHGGHAPGEFALRFFRGQLNYCIGNVWQLDVFDNSTDCLFAKFAHIEIKECV
jgi:hypothetical protein